MMNQVFKKYVQFLVRLTGQIKRAIILLFVAYVLMGCASGVSFIRQNNDKYTTKTQGAYLCDTGIKVLQDWVERDEAEYANIYIVYRYPEVSRGWSFYQRLRADDRLDRALILALDIDKDGLYDYLIFDTDGNGKFDMELEGGHTDEQGVMWLYCQYQRLEMS